MIFLVGPGFLVFFPVMHRTGQGYGLNLRDFRKIAPNGFGDPYNAYPHSMLWFKDHLFVGTTRANLAYRGKWHADKDPQWLGEVWPVKIPDGLFDIDLRAEIWRYHPPSDQWTRVYQSPLVKGVDGFDVPLSIGFRTMAEFKGPSDPEPALYVPTWGSHQTPATVMLRSMDGVHFEVVSEPGLGLPDPKPRALRGLVPFKGRLFTSPAVGAKRREPNIAGKGNMVVLTSTDPAGGKWELAAEPHFGNPNNLTVFHMGVFNDHLYAGTLNINDGYEVWKTDGEGKPPFRWQRVVRNGAYRGKLNQVAMTLRAFGDYLYVGSAIQNGGFDVDAGIGPASPEIIRIARDDSWELITGEPRLTPDGLKVPLSGLGPAFGNPFASYLWSMCVHDGWLYAGNAVWTIFLRYSRKGSNWPAHIRRIFDLKNIEKMIHEAGGCTLWRSRDGMRWVPVTLNGFGNYFNMGFRTMASTPYGLFVGAANPFAPEVAVQRIAGWHYEDNPHGGLEVWFGSHHPKKATAPAKAREQKSAREALIADFYSHSGFRHLGFWKEGIKTAEAACENLVREVMAFIPKGCASMVEIGCGGAATTRCLVQEFPSSAITGIVTSRAAAERCKAYAPSAAFSVSKLPTLKRPAASAEVVTWFKGHERLGSRPKLLREAFRVLQPGGTLVGFDLLCSASLKDVLTKNLGAAEITAPSQSVYRHWLEKAGFGEIQLIDVTKHTLKGFVKQVKKFIQFHRHSGVISEEVLTEVETELLAPTAVIRACLLVRAKKA